MAAVAITIEQSASELPLGERNSLYEDVSPAFLSVLVFVCIYDMVGS